MGEGTESINFLYISLDFSNNCGIMVLLCESICLITQKEGTL